jgi:hypothetical protein
MAKRTRSGTCHICGQVGDLSEEHVPPRAAFNKIRYIAHESRFIEVLPPGARAKGKIEQGGVGMYTLCERCNNNTGDWYADGLVGFCRQAMEVLEKTDGQPSIYYPYRIYPLQVLKQVVTMFFSVNNAQFGRRQPNLVRFILNRDQRYLPPGFRFYLYYNTSNWRRYVGLSGVLDLSKGRSTLISEINFPPFGYVMTTGEDPPHQGLFEITYFDRYPYDCCDLMSLRLPLLETHTSFPGDYRAMPQIIEEAGLPEGTQIKGPLL